MFKFIGLMFVLIGALFIYMGRKARAQGQLEHSWPTVQGVTKTAQVTAPHGGPGNDGFGYVPQVTYEYTVGGKTFTGTKIGVIPSQGFNEMRTKQIVAQHKPGTAVTVHYDPADPAHATTRPAAKGGGLIVVLGTLIFIVGIPVLLAGLFLGA